MHVLCPVLPKGLSWTYQVPEVMNMVTKHDELQNSFITHWENSRKIFEGDGQEKFYSEFGVEEPFNYFGQSGFIDFYSISPSVHHRHKKTLLIYDFKTSIEDIGETIRQLKKYKEYFPKKFENKYKIAEVITFIVLDITDEKTTNIIDEYIESFNVAGISIMWFNCKTGENIVYHPSINIKREGYWEGIKQQIDIIR